MLLLSSKRLIREERLYRVKKCSTLAHLGEQKATFSGFFVSTPEPLYTQDINSTTLFSELVRKPPFPRVKPDGKTKIH